MEANGYPFYGDSTFETIQKLHNLFQSNIDALWCIAKGLVLRVVELHRRESITNKATLSVFCLKKYYLLKPGNTGKAVVLLLQKVI